MNLEYTSSQGENLLNLVKRVETLDYIMVPGMNVLNFEFASSPGKNV